MLSEWPRGLLLILFAVYTIYTMEPIESEESGEMYLPDDQGEYVAEVGAELLCPGTIRCFNSPGNCD